MFNVDTISLGINLNDISRKSIYIFFKSVKDYVLYMDKKFKAKLYLNEENRLKKKYIQSLNNRNRQYFITDCIYWFGKDNGYSFCYNETRKALTITLLHYKVEQYTASEIITQTRDKIFTYFELETTELPAITLRRIDYYCDYRYRDNHEYQIIKDIVSKATDTFYTYNKEITDTDEKYVVKYLAEKEKYKTDKLSISKETVLDKEAMIYYET